MITVKARFDGRVFIPQEPVDLPAETVLEIAFAAPTARGSAPAPLAPLAEIAYLFPANPDLPADFADQHDHYLYGTPKRP